MKGRIVLSLIFFFIPVFALAASDLEIFSKEILLSAEYQNSDLQWDIYNNASEDIIVNDKGALINNDGDAFLVYPTSFSYSDFDVLRMTLSVDQDTEITVIPDVSTTGFNTYELKQILKASPEVQTISFSLRLPFFKTPVSDIAVNFKSNNSSEVIISNIVLQKNSLVGVGVQSIKDYFNVSPYSPFTVNLIPTPRIFGYSAMVYFLPFLILILLLFFFFPKWRKLSAGLLLAIWIITDLRMGYEFFQQRVADYQSYVKPVDSEKVLRTYSDFYTFVDFAKESIPQNSKVNFYNFGSSHFPRILQYQLYPSTVYSDGQEAEYFVFYNRSDVSVDAATNSLHIGDEVLDRSGEIIARFNDNSFIFQAK